MQKDGRGHWTSSNRDEHRSVARDQPECRQAGERDRLRLRLGPFVVGEQQRALEGVSLRAGQVVRDLPDGLAHEVADRRERDSGLDLARARAKHSMRRLGGADRIQSVVFPIPASPSRSRISASRCPGSRNDAPPDRRIDHPLHCRRERDGGQTAPSVP